MLGRGLQKCRIRRQGCQIIQNLGVKCFLTLPVSQVFKLNRPYNDVVWAYLDKQDSSLQAFSSAETHTHARWNALQCQQMVHIPRKEIKGSVNQTDYLLHACVCSVETCIETYAYLPL